MKAILMVFTKNFLLGANDSFWPQRWHMPITSKNFFEILHNERSYLVHRNYVNGFFPKKILFGANGLFRTQMSSQLWIHCQDCFKILHNERGQERYGNFINGFSEKNLILGNFAVLAQKWYCSQFFFILHKNGAKRYMVVLLVVFLNKNHI